MKRKKRGESPKGSRKTREKLRLMQEIEKRNDRKIREWTSRREQGGERG